MKYEKIKEGRFVERPNRFIALVELDGKVEQCHVKNTGRCKELLVPGARVWLDQSLNPNRKTAYDLVAVEKCGRGIVNMDSQAPNKAVHEWLEQQASAQYGGCAGSHTLFPDILSIQPECRYGNSRIDFYLEAGRERLRKVFIEVKGVTLEEDGIARFPDAPTERGIKHMLELGKAIKAGYEAWILFVIQMEGIRWFEPNDRTHPQFGETLRQVQKEGVGVLAYGCNVSEDEMALDMPTEVKLHECKN